MCAGWARCESSIREPWRSREDTLGAAATFVPSAVGQITIEAVMTRPVLTITAGANAREALDLMRSRGVSNLVVVDDRGRVEAVLSIGDLHAAEPSTLLVPDRVMREKGLALLKVRDIMVPRPWTVAAGDPVRRVLDLMRDTRVGSVPVVDVKGQPIGVVTGMDIVRLALRLLDERKG
jgi:CBS domain-containing protein